MHFPGGKSSSQSNLESPRELKKISRLGAPDILISLVLENLVMAVLKAHQVIPLCNVNMSKKYLRILLK